MKKPTQEAHKLLMKGTLMLARMEHNGMKLDMDYLERTIDDVEAAIKEAEAQLKTDHVWKIWKKRFGDRANLGSSDQLATVVYKELGHPCESLTATGKFKADEEALQKIDEPFIKGYFAKKKLEKALTTYLYGFRREQVDGVLHPSFNFNPRSYRSCVAKGTLIEVVRDVRKYPKGIPIENVQTGDLVYCYDQNRELCLRKVIWAGKTGHRKVIRLHWRARGKYGHIDVTPEHKIRLRSGEYVEAQFLDGADFRNSTDKKKSPKIATLAMGRNGHRIYATGKAEQLEHRFVYEQLFGPLGNQVVHHKDGNHWNNAPSNLEAMSNKEHSRYHAPTTLTHEIRLKGVRKRQANHALYGDRFSKGDQSPNWINISRFGFMRLLIQSGCRPTKTNLDYETVIARCKLFGINLKFVADRFDGEGHYITLGRTRLLHAQGLTPMMRSLRVNFYKLRRLLKQRGLSEQRRWGNQFGLCIPHNHAIIRVEQLDTPVDVYDLEVEEHHNFIANEICVHNSCSDPNVQNIPSRGKTLPKLLRDCFIPRRGRRIVEIDYSQLEVRIAACYHKDPNMLKYIRDPSTDMHRDTAMDLFMLPMDQVEKKTTRDWTKNRFVFPVFYGSVFFQCAPNLWKGVESGAKLPNGKTIKDHLADKGITELGEKDSDYKSGRIATKPGTFMDHVRKVEDIFWKERFPVYTEWKQRWWKQYSQEGGYHMLSGFAINGVFKRNDVLNWAIQGSSFHCLLWSAIEIQKYLDKHKMKTKLINEIHDCLVADVPESELQEYLYLARKVMVNRCMKHFPWIIVPLEIEAEVTPEGGTWFSKQVWEDTGSEWRLKQ